MTNTGPSCMGPPVVAWKGRLSKMLSHRAISQTLSMSHKGTFVRSLGRSLARRQQRPFSRMVTHSVPHRLCPCAQARWPMCERSTFSRHSLLSRRRFYCVHVHRRRYGSTHLNCRTSLLIQRNLSDDTAANVNWPTIRLSLLVRQSISVVTANNNIHRQCYH